MRWQNYKEILGYTNKNGSFCLKLPFLTLPNRFFFGRGSVEGQSTLSRGGFKARLQFRSISVACTDLLSLTQSPRKARILAGLGWG